MGLRIHCQFVPMAFTVQVVIQDSSVRLYSDTAKTLGDIIPQRDLARHR